MIPIQNRDSTTHNGNRLTNMTLDPFCFMLNSIAMGDVIAAVPVVKHMVETYYTREDSYYVVAKQIFRPLFPFVPDSNWRDYDSKEKYWGIPETTLLGLLTKKKEPGLTRMTPKHMTLGQFASIALADRILPERFLNYVPLVPVDVSHLGTFTKSVVLVTSYRDVTRMWHAEHVLKVASWLNSKGIQPVFIGKTDMDATARAEIVPKSALPDDVSEYGLDLRNRTSIAELATIMGQSLAVCGLDSGPVHLAGTTSVPLVCGYTSVTPENRIPQRLVGKTYAIAPEIECIGCESRWRSNFWNYENCYLGHARCCSEMTANRFINVLDTFL